MRSRHFLPVAFVAGIFLAGCTSLPVSGDKADLQARIDAIGHSRLLGDKFYHYYIPTNGIFFDAGQMATIQTDDNSRRVVDLAKWLRDGASAHAKLAVSGANNALTALVIERAFAKFPSPSLDGLDFMYLGDSSYFDSLRLAVERSGAKFYAVPF